MEKMGGATGVSDYIVNPRPKEKLNFNTPNRGFFEHYH